MAIKKTKKKEEPAEPAGAPKVFDVAKPGKTAADPTARPVIVGHGSMIKQDPMVVPIEVSDAETKMPASTEGVKIVPIVGVKSSKNEDKSVEADEKPEDADIKPEPEILESEKEESKDEETPAPEETSEEVVEPTPEEEPAEEKAEAGSTDSGSAATDALANQAASQKADQKKSEQEAKKAEELAKLIESKKYFVKVHQGPAGHSYASWLLVILFVISIGVVLAIDAGYLNVGIALPFDMIKN